MKIRLVQLENIFSAAFFSERYTGIFWISGIFVVSETSFADFIGVVGITYFSVCRENAVQELSVRTETKSRMSLLCHCFLLGSGCQNPSWDMN